MVGRRRAARARGVVLWGIAGFIVLQLGLGVAIECGLWRFRDPYFQHKIVHLRRQWQERSRDDTSTPTKLVVMLGSSRVGNGLRGFCLEEEVYAATGERWRAANFGVPAGGPVIALVNLRRLLAEGIHPDFVLIEVMPLFHSEPVIEAGLITSVRLAPADFASLDQCGLPTNQTLRQHWCTDWAAPWYAHRFSILSELAPLFVPMNLQQNWSAKCDPTGWVEAAPDPNRTPERAAAALNVVKSWLQPTLREFRPAEPGRVAVCAILEECRARGIPTVLVQLPEASTIRAWYGPAARAEFPGIVADLQARYGVPMIDAREWVGDDSFVDGIHLFPDGAELFTRRLAHEVLPMLLCGQHSGSGQQRAQLGSR